MNGVPLPEWLTQFIFYVGTACAAIYAGWKGYTSKKVAKADETVRTAIVAGDLMDTKLDEYKAAIIDGSSVKKASTPRPNSSCRRRA